MLKGFLNDPEKISRVMAIGSLAVIFLAAVMLKDMDNITWLEAFYSVFAHMVLGFMFSIPGLLLLLFYVSQSCSTNEDLGRGTRICWLISALYNLGGVLFWFRSFIAKLFTAIWTSSSTIISTFNNVSNLAAEIAAEIVAVWVVAAFLMSLAAFSAKPQAEAV